MRKEQIMSGESAAGPGDVFHQEFSNAQHIVIFQFGVHSILQC